MDLIEPLINLAIGLAAIFGVLALVVAVVFLLVMAVSWAIEPLDDDDEEEEFRADEARLEEQLERDRQHRDNLAHWHQPW